MATLTPPATVAAHAAEPTRARYPDEEGYVERDGQRLFYEVYGEGERTLFLLPTWTLIHSRFWRSQIPYFARHMRVVTFDGLGNGRSDRPQDPRRYDFAEFAKDSLAVMDATGTDRAVIAALSRGAQWALKLAADHGDRVEAAIFIGPFAPISLGSQLTYRTGAALMDHWLGRVLRPLSPIGRLHPEEIVADYPGFVEWWMRRCLPEPHSEWPVEISTAWALDTDARTLATTLGGRVMFDRRSIRDLASRVACPTLVIEGELDAVTPPADAKALARALGAPYVEIPDMGHSVGRKPVPVNLAMRDFVAKLDASSDGAPRRRDPTVHRDDGRPRALYISSPIGLGHALRDVAIAKELRNLVPGLQVDWLAQDPVTRVLEAEGERIHPASEHLANESHHIECESAEHDLHCFQALRSMDEILLSNFMLFDDVVRDQRYDLWVGDEAWELDYYLHENPGLKRAPYVWLSDFIGALPMDDGGDRERFLTADWNAQRIEHVEGLPHVRDRSIFVGNLEDIVTERFGPELPVIREWAERHYDPTGYITGFDTRDLRDREALRAELGYAPDELVCLVTVGGSGVGESLLRKVIDAYPAARAQIPNLRMIAVCGPRIDPASLPREDGLELRAYVHNLYRHLAASDLAVVQGGLTTSMELTAGQRPFLYFPLRHHFEQNFHVRHRLERYRAGRRMDFDESTREDIADAIAAEIGREVDYLPVETDGARRAAERIAELL
jgi:pimeloyl-ACP methyl ester carboxylesterase/predicted glycosyltransferase